MACPVMTRCVNPVSIDRWAVWIRGRVESGRTLVLDSRRVQSGDVFLAVPGHSSDGREFIDAAIDRGAVAVLAQAGDSMPVGERVRRGVLIRAVPNLQSALPELAAEFWGHPSATLSVLAVTGTNGKTSVTHWLQQVLAARGEQAAVVGTLGARSHTGEQVAAAQLTTPDAVSMQTLLAQLSAEGTQHVAVEASSIGLVQGRLRGTKIAAAALTNLTRDHLDYHGTMEAYADAKRLLLQDPTIPNLVLNLGDDFGQEVARSEVGQGRFVIGYWVAGEACGRPEIAHLCAVSLEAREIAFHPQGVSFQLIEAQSGRDAIKHDVKIPLLGRHNIENVLAVLGMARTQGHEIATLVPLLSDLQAPAGRLQAVPLADYSALAVIDYAHTPDALAKALDALRPVAEARGGRLWVVFGCGGDRDTGKRPEMGRIATEKSDEVVLTNDNPRSEDPQAILDDIQKGAGERALRIPDRAKAIAYAIQQSESNDVILVAGKGHEPYQEIAGVRHPYSDEFALNLAGRRPVYAGLGAAPDGAISSVRDLLNKLPSATLISHTADLERGISGFSTDTRSLEPGAVFIALRGERFDAHNFAVDAVKAGAAAVLVEKPIRHVAAPQIMVRDTHAALSALGAAWRKDFNLPILAVAGSNGKTTVKEMIGSILTAAHGPAGAYKTPGNLNNAIGVPMSLLGLRRHHRAAVFELGTNHPGEIAPLSAQVAPTVALVTNAQREHQEYFDGVEGSARENATVFMGLGLGLDGVAVYPADDACSAIFASAAAGRKAMTFGFTDQADVWAHTPKDHSTVVVQTPKGSFSVQLQIPGVHSVRNALAATAAALASGVTLKAIAEGLANFQPVKGRLQRFASVSGASLIDDTYNANPDSVRAAIDVLAVYPSPRILVLGDMGEVGDQGPAFHSEVGAYARQQGIDHLLAFGEQAQFAARAFGDEALSAMDVDAAVAALSPFLSERSTVLVKGSRFMRTERILEALKAYEPISGLSESVQSLPNQGEN